MIFCNIYNMAGRMHYTHRKKKRTCNVTNTHTCSHTSVCCVVNKPQNKHCGYYFFFACHTAIKHVWLNAGASVANLQLKTYPPRTHSHGVAPTSFIIPTDTNNTRSFMILLRGKLVMDSCRKVKFTH